MFQYLPTEVGLLQPVLAILPEWCRILAQFPVVTWYSFVEFVRSRINILATEDHLRELVSQLVVIGEVEVVYSLSPVTAAGATTTADSNSHQKTPHFRFRAKRFSSKWFAFILL